MLESAKTVYILSVIILLSSALLLHESHMTREETYIRSSGMIYSWRGYKCVGGVMYSTGRSDTLMVEKDGTPKTCENIKMTNRAYKNL